jgi:hypothetical protein
MRVLVACEFSGTVRDAFIAAGHDAMSCDLLATEAPGPHYQGDIRDVLGDGWDLMIAHPPCTDLAVSGARWFATKRDSQRAALRFVEALLAAPIPRIALENPVSIISTRIRKPDQIIQPWQFGHPRAKGRVFGLRSTVSPANERPSDAEDLDESNAERSEPARSIGRSVEGAQSHLQRNRSRDGNALGSARDSRAA